MIIAPDVESLRAAVDVWTVDPAVVADPQVREACNAVLSESERRAADRFVDPQRRFAALAARALARQSLSRYAPVAPEAWRFTANRFGRPEIADDVCETPLRFNISHTPGLVACAVSLSSDVGVDVERRARGADILEIAERVLAPEEIETLNGLDGAAKEEQAAVLWTLKEAYAKGRGVGLSLPFRRLRFAMSDGAPTFDPDTDVEVDAEAWRLSVHYPTPEHVLSVAVRRPPPVAVRVRGAPKLAMRQGETAQLAAFQH